MFVSVTVFCSATKTLSSTSNRTLCIGPVHCELPEDIARQMISSASGTLFDIHPVRRPIAEEKAIRQAVDMIKRAQAPVLCIGGGANRKRTSNMLSQFVNQIRIPFVSTQMGKGVVDDNHALNLGTAALSDNDYVHVALKACDLGECSAMLLGGRICAYGSVYTILSNLVAAVSRDYEFSRLLRAHLVPLFLTLQCELIRRYNTHSLTMQ